MQFVFCEEKIDSIELHCQLLLIEVSIVEPLLRGQMLLHNEMSYLFGGLLVLGLLRSTYSSTLLLEDSTYFAVPFLTLYLEDRDSELDEDSTAGMEPHSSSRKQKGRVSRHYFFIYLNGLSLFSY